MDPSTIDDDRKEAESDIDDEEDMGEGSGDEDDREDEGDEDDREDEGDDTTEKTPVISGDGGDDEADDDFELMDDDYIKRVHPEAILPDSRELRKILADKDTVRRSRPILSKYEATSIVGMRAQQIIKGSAPFLDTDETDPIEIAIEELRAKLIPVIIRRVMPDNESEYWRLSELTYYD